MAKKKKFDATSFDFGANVRTGKKPSGKAKKRRGGKSRKGNPFAAARGS